MEMTTGIYGLMPRFPEEKPPINFQPVTHNIRVQNSQVGSINTGRIDNLKVVMAGLAETNPELAEGLNALANATVNEPSVADETRKELFDLIEAVSEESAKPTKRKAVLMPLATRIGELAQGAAALWVIWERVWPLLKPLL